LAAGERPRGPGEDVRGGGSPWPLAAGDHGRRVPELVVELVDEVRAEQPRSEQAHHREGGERQREQRGDEPEPERYPPPGGAPRTRHHALARGGRSTYPIPRTVWISGCSPASSLRRRYDTYDSTMLPSPSKS